MGLLPGEEFHEYLEAGYERYDMGLVADPEVRGRLMPLEVT